MTRASPMRICAPAQDFSGGLGASARNTNTHNDNVPPYDLQQQQQRLLSRSLLGVGVLVLLGLLCYPG